MPQRHISPPAERCSIGYIGWRTFRHTFRSLLHETGAPLRCSSKNRCATLISEDR